jgi:uncharacterized protein YbaR (Trm112 family)
MIAPDILALLACPICKGQLSQNEGALHCAACPRVFPVVDGIPDLVP